MTIFKKGAYLTRSQVFFSNPLTKFYTHQVKWEMQLTVNSLGPRIASAIGGPARPHAYEWSEPLWKGVTVVIKNQCLALHLKVYALQLHRMGEPVLRRRNVFTYTPPS